MGWEGKLRDSLLRPRLGSRERKNEHDEMIINQIDSSVLGAEGEKAIIGDRRTLKDARCGLIA